jgi:hypothetical protein
MYLNKCLYNLKMIATIAPGQKICTRDEYISQEPISNVAGMYRMRADGRDKMITRVHDIVHACIEIADRIIESHYLVVKPKGEIKIEYATMRTQRIGELRTIWGRLGDSKHGIEGQNQTYPGDARIGHAIQELITYIDEARTRIRIALQSVDEQVW